MMNPIEKWAEEILTALLNGPMMYRGSLPEDGRALEIIARCLRPNHDALVLKQQRIEKLEAIIAASLREEGCLRDHIERLEQLMREAGNQIQYLHDKFQETGSGNSVIARIDALLEHE